MKRGLTKFLTVVLGFVMALIVTGCESKTTETLSFQTLSDILLQFDTDVRPFLSSLEYKYQEDENKEYLTASASLIKSISYDMGESFKGFNELITTSQEMGGGGVTVSQKEEEITIKTINADFKAQLNKNKTCLSIKHMSGNEEYLIEISVRNLGGYYAQIVSKNKTETYSIYQLRFAENKGSFSISEGETNYISIYNAEINDSVFPSVSAMVFSNE